MPYNIALLSKFPPIEGGIAAKTYWMARGLAERGHKVHVITNAIGDGQEYDIQNIGDHLEHIPNIQVHRPQSEMPWHIPDSDEKALSLLDLSIKVIREQKIQIIDTGYMIPYGILGHLCKLATGVHHIMRHGGSDLHKFLEAGLLTASLTEAITHADRVITEKQHTDLFKAITPRLVYQSPYIANAGVFSFKNLQGPQRRLGIIGKINYHWKQKGLHHIAEIVELLKDQFKYWIVGQGLGMSDFKQSIERRGISKFDWRPFVAPWEMPSLLNQLSAVFIFESELPHAVFSNLALEAISSGVGIITDRNDFTETYKDFINIGDSQILVVSPSKPAESAEKISKWIERRYEEKPKAHQAIAYGEYILNTERVYDDILELPTG